MTISIGSGTAQPSQIQHAKVEESLKRMFLTEALKSSGIADSKGLGAGGAGENQFSSFLLEEYAATLSDSLKINLSR